MSKRPPEGERDDRPPKRPKPDKPKQQRPPPEEIQFAGQLQQLLVFRQDGLQQLRHGIASFKAFLDNILYQKDEDTRPRQLSILREYLDSEKPTNANDLERPFLGQLWQAWSFASQNYNDQLSSSVSAIIALLLKVLSTVLDLREHGVLLCRTVLQHQHLRFIKRGLDAPKGRDFVISPCLRLLIEVASFDGGVMAKDLYKRRDLTFDVGTTRRNLGLVRTDIPEEELHRKSSIRTWTVRYVLVLLKHLHEGGKIDILSSRPICTALMAHLRVDPSELVIEILDVVEKHVLKDSEVPRSAKSALLIQQNLERVTEVATRSREGHPAAQKAFDWLKSVCTISSYGLFRPSGWYPAGTTEKNDAAGDTNTIDLGLDSIEFYDHSRRPEMRNPTTLQWILQLRPHNHLQESELVLACFKSAPELVAGYFADKNMSFDPKLTNTWVGYASFMFEVVRLAVPPCFGNEQDWAELPPQTNIMIESILPRPLTQKILTRCLTSNSDLITFFAARILVLAFEKLSAVQYQLNKGADSSNDRAALWHTASERLLTRFVERCPSVKQVDTVLRKMPQDDEHTLQREALSRLLRLYFAGTPLPAFEAKLDISAALTIILEMRASETESSEVSEVKALELEHLLQVARQSPDMRWLSKQGSLQHSPLVTLLKIHRNDLQNRPMRALIQHVLIEHNVVNNNASCDALLASLTDVADWAFTTLGTFLEECFSRASQRPVKYLDDLEKLCPPSESEIGQESSMPSLLVAVLLEQASFIAGKLPTERDNLVPWMASFLEISLISEENPTARRVIEKAQSELDLWTVYQGTSRLGDLLSKVKLVEQVSKRSETTANWATIEFVIPFSSPPIETEDHPELFKWAKKDIDIALEDGQTDALILCLCSQYPEIRTQAHTQLYKLQESLHNSALDDKEPLYLVLGELIETYEHHCVPKSAALPYLAGTFATKALYVQMQPSHFMYMKVNGYLNKGPEWRIQKMPKYWIENTMLSTPDEDDAYWKEAEWVLSWLVDGLRTPADLNILRRGGVFERVMSFCGSPGAAAHENVKDKVMELIWRATFVTDGATTLITRTGVLSWLDMIPKNDNGIEKALRKRLLELCDKEKIEEWSGRKLEEL